MAKVKVKKISKKIVKKTTKKTTKKVPKNAIKKVLLLEDVYDIESEYYKLMTDIIKLNCDFPKKVIKDRELHHIIMKNMYKTENLGVDNTDNNLVSLSKEDHFLIHYYSYKCCKQPYKRSTARAVYLMRKRCLVGDSMKSPVINAIIADFHIITADAKLKDGLKYASKSKRKSFTLDILDTLLLDVMTHISKVSPMCSIYEKLGKIGHTNSFQRYVDNANKNYEKITGRNAIEDSTPLIEIMSLIYSDTLKKCFQYNKNSKYMYDTTQALHFLAWYICEYHIKSDIYNESDTLNDVVEKYNSYQDKEAYLSYINSLSIYRCLKGGEWYNDGIIEGRFIQNPDPQFFKKGRLS